LPKIFSELKGKSIDELFFYFSGHGSFINDEFYYILSDFAEMRKDKLLFKTQKLTI
jgi:hypothetical protein